MSPGKAIRVLLVEDSPLAMLLLKRMLDIPDIEVIGEAIDGEEGLDLAISLRPDVICTDLHMPRMDGLGMTQEIMRKAPTPILVISCSVQQDDTDNIFKLMQAGALDILPKPRGSRKADYNRTRQELVNKIKVLAGVVLIRRHTIRQQHAIPVRPPDNPQIRMVAIGSSTGGPVALQQIFSALPASFPAPIICVQHISEGFLVDLAKWLATECSLRVQSAATGMLPMPGAVYFAPDNANLEIDKSGRLRIIRAPKSAIHRPSITTTFNSVAAYYGQSALGVLLTGMGSDGATGLQTIRQAGGITLAQDKASSIVYGIPKVAFELGAVQHVLALNQIAKALLEMANEHHVVSNNP